MFICRFPYNICSRSFNCWTVVSSKRGLYDCPWLLCFLSMISCVLLSLHFCYLISYVLIFETACIFDFLTSCSCFWLVSLNDLVWPFFLVLFSLPNYSEIWILSFWLSVLVFLSALCSFRFEFCVFLSSSRWFLATLLLFFCSLALSSILLK